MRAPDPIKVDIRVVKPAMLYPLRQSILRPHQSLSEMQYPHDYAVDTLHLGGFSRDHSIVAIATCHREPKPLNPSPGDWRLRGMAVAESVRGRGVGRQLMQVMTDRVAKKGGRRVWCHARVSAQGFYTRLGFGVCSEPFEIPAIGPHVVMSIAIPSKPR